MPDTSRRRFLAQAGRAAAAGLAAGCLPLPGWARSALDRSDPVRYREFDLAIGRVPLVIGDRRAAAIGLNGTVPGPLLRFREGDRITLNVTNELTEDSSIHWHGLMVPAGMDGVPGISFPGILPGETFRYQFDVVQNGTYWYHSHSGFQEQLGLYGPIVIDPAGADPVAYDREFVILLSDWTFEDPYRVFANLKRFPEYYNRQRRTLGDLFDDAAGSGWKAALAERRMWGGMRMSPADIADVTASTYTYLLNGYDPVANWTGVFEPGQRIRLRFINGSAMSFFNVRIPGMPMTIVQADGIDLEPVVVEEFQIGVAETYDAIVEPAAGRAYTVFAESMDRSGYARGTLAPVPGMQAAVPELRPSPLLTMADMGMAGHGTASPAAPAGGHEAGMHHHTADTMQSVAHEHAQGIGVDYVAGEVRERLDEPGIGLNDSGHRVLRYTDLKGLEPGPDPRPPGRILELHLTGNMHRYMWSFDGIKFSEVEEPIRFRYGERLRLVLVNDTMMAHPIHLHGMFVELVNGNGTHNPRKHTVMVRPAERLSVDVTADARGDWAFHCHLLYHMAAGMMQVVSVVDASETAS
ncbi:MAG: copper resistance system multicopper oxidase [Woeseiaceae bacterium]